MSETLLYPLLLEPSLHVKVWGGRKLADVMGKQLPTDEPYGESWEMHDTSTVANGPLSGKLLGEVLSEYGAQLIGPHSNPADGMPLLVKILDASDWLSVQVHPNDEQAKALEGEPRGKTEAWYVLAADPGAQLVIGVKPGTKREDMAQAIRDGDLERLLIKADVTAGDTLYMPAGSVHALGPGNLIYEIQQSSNTTYRLFDWNRMGLDGKPREMHIDKGVQVSNVDSLPEITYPARQEDSAKVTIVSGDFFSTVLHRVAEDSPAAANTLDSHFHALTCIAGQVEIRAGEHRVSLVLGRTALIPALLGKYTLHGEGEVLRSFQAV